MPDTLWLDSSVAFSATKVRTIGELARAKEVKVVVSAHIHLEQYRKTREVAARKGDSFSVLRFRSVLATFNIEVADLHMDMLAAEAWGELLHVRYPSSDAWKAAKLACVRARLPGDTTLPGERVPMTTDWLIALEVERRGAYVAVGDQGEEWAALRAASPKRAFTYEETLAWLRA